MSNDHFIEAAVKGVQQDYATLLIAVQQANSVSQPILDAIFNLGESLEQLRAAMDHKKQS